LSKNGNDNNKTGGSHDVETLVKETAFLSGKDISSSPSTSLSAKCRSSSALDLPSVSGVSVVIWNLSTRGTGSLTSTWALTLGWVAVALAFLAASESSSGSSVFDLADVVFMAEGLWQEVTGESGHAWRRRRARMGESREEEVEVEVEEVIEVGEVDGDARRSWAVSTEREGGCIDDVGVKK